jgi:hypothetical protein
MDSTLCKQLAKELATKVNALVNIPLVKEEDEQAFFEMIILLILEIILNRMGLKLSK